MTYRSQRPGRAVVPADFYDRPSPQVAPDLVGKLLVRDEDGAPPTVARVLETEAYREDDPASHSFRGPTPRNAVMFDRGGLLYVYFTYGAHFCMNVSCEAPGVGSAVLLRSALLLAGEDAVRTRRGGRASARDLLRGPGRLTAGFGIDRSWDGTDVTDASSPLRIEDDGWRPAPGEVATGPRVGIRQAVEIPWRFWLADAPEVSRYTRHPRAGTT